MFSRVGLSSIRLCARQSTVRKFGFMEDMIQKQIQNSADKVLGNPEAMAKAMSQFENVVNGSLGQNPKVKAMIESMGGMENIQRMMSDPKFTKSMSDLMKDPEKVKEASSKVADLLKHDDALEGKSN